MHGCVPVLVQAVHAGVSANIYADLTDASSCFLRIHTEKLHSYMGTYV